MKNLILVLLITGIFSACVSPDKKDPAETSEKKHDKSEKTEEEEPQNNYIEINTDEALTTTALMAAPRENRERCKVIGYNMQGEFVTLKEGDNEFICLADDPRQKGFSAACYHKSLEPFMSRGRELRVEGKTREEIFNIREEEVKSGKLQMGKSGATLHIYSGPDNLYDTSTSAVKGANYRYVVYLPWATSESTGLPENPVASNHPWIMDPGTHKAHIMITPVAME